MALNQGAPIAIIGAGPAGLMAADVLSRAGAPVIVFERMASVGRKFLMAGRGGLNLTHSEDVGAFMTRYGAAAANLAPMLEAFTSRDLIAWAEALGEPTFVGSSGRVFPVAMKASPLLRKWMARLGAQGVSVRARTRWLGWDEARRPLFEHADGRVETIEVSATLLALGGASWPRLGSDGAWRESLQARGVTVNALRPANVGFEAAWSEHFRGRFVGQPLKNIALRFSDQRARGEVIITKYGLEGGALYTLSAPLRDALARASPRILEIDLRPDLPQADIAARLTRAKHGDTLSSTLRKALGLAPIAINLLRENGAAPTDPGALAALIKATPVTLTAARGIERAISSAGGVAWSELDERLMVRALPGVYVAGEMLDWEAPTGGYLLQACFATGAWAAHAILERRA
ncbi:MAG: TIGR03862 family flavoprotein [Terricaulis sp.]